MTDARIDAAERVLAMHGVYGAEVSVEGHEREIAAVRVQAQGAQRIPAGDFSAQPGAKRVPRRAGEIGRAPCRERV